MTRAKDRDRERARNGTTAPAWGTEGRRGHPTCLHLAGHEHEELWEVYGAIAVCIHLVDHVLKLGLSGVLPQRAHDCAQLLGGDGPWKYAHTQLVTG